MAPQVQKRTSRYKHEGHQGQKRCIQDRKIPGNNPEKRLLACGDSQLPHGDPSTTMMFLKVRGLRSSMKPKFEPQTLNLIFSYPEKCKPSVLPPLSNSWIRIIIWLYIALNRTPNIYCYWVGAVPNLNPKSVTASLLSSS